MHWSDNFVKKIISVMGDKESYTLAAGITPSGTVHLGNFREVITVDIMARALKKAGKKVRFIYSWDDYDVFRRVPVNLPEDYKVYLRQPIVDIPDVNGKYSSFAEYNEKVFEEQVEKLGIYPEYIYQSKMYRASKYADGIKISLENKDKIKSILDEYRKEPLSDDWVPVSVFCSKCNKDTTKVLSFNDYNLKYSCECGHEEELDYRSSGNVKLVWRVDWPMRWDYEKVDFESGGKDHYASGGSRETGEKIYKEIWNGKITGFMYDWISVKGGKEFSSSKGIVVTINDALQIYEPEIVRYLFAGTKPNSPFAVSFDLDVLKIYEDFDKCERIYFKEEAVKEKEYLKQKRIYELSLIDESKIPEKLPIQPKFRHLTNLLQIYNFDKSRVFDLFEVNTDYDKSRLRTRIECAENWVKLYAPEDFKFSLNNSIDVEENDKSLIVSLLERVKNSSSAKDLHNSFYELCSEFNIESKDFFVKMYNYLINKNKGPQLANFLLTIGHEELVKIFKI